MDIKLLSVIVPIYKQEKTIKQDLLNIYNTLEQTPYSFEILGVIDGTSLDNSFEEAKSTNKKEIRVYGYPTNHGKGQAVRFGMRKARGNIVTYIDGGMDIHPTGITMMIEHMKWYKADIILGSKLHSASIVKHYSFNRKIFTYGYYFLVKILFGFKVRDIQTGMKAYKRKVLVDVVDKLVIKQFAFEAELLAVADNSGYKKIYDCPVYVDWGKQNAHSEFFSKRILKTIWDFLWDTLAIWYRLRILHYYDDGKKRVKKYDQELGYYVNTGDMYDQSKQAIIESVNKVLSNLTSFFKK